jgi:hypothetical protein
MRSLPGLAADVSAGVSAGDDCADRAAPGGRARIWKGSRLVLPFYGLNGRVLGKRAERMDEMEEVPKRVAVRIEDEGKGTKLILLP